MAYPFSGSPTRQQVELAGFPAVWAMCAIDALGVPVMAGRDGRIAAVDPRDGAPVVVSVKGAGEAGGGNGAGHPPAPSSSSPARQAAARTARSGRCSARTPPSTPAGTVRGTGSPPGPASMARSWASGPPSSAGGATSARCSAARHDRGRRPAPRRERPAAHRVMRHTARESDGVMSAALEHAAPAAQAGFSDRTCRPCGPGRGSSARRQG